MDEKRFMQACEVAQIPAEVIAQFRYHLPKVAKVYDAMAEEARESKEPAA